MDDSTVYGNPSRMRGEKKWGDVGIGTIEHEDRLPSEGAKTVWSDVFRLFRAQGEKAQDEVKLAVYGYYAVNGSSKRTKHSRDMNTAGGVNVLAADVMDVIGQERIREFLRSDPDEGYCALKESGILESDAAFVAKAMKKGVPRGFMHCAADFLRGCSLFTPEEEYYAEKCFQYSIRRANASRSGFTIEEEDEVALGKNVDVQRRESSRTGRSKSEQF